MCACVRFCHVQKAEVKGKGKRDEDTVRLAKTTVSVFVQLNRRSVAQEPPMGRSGRVWISAAACCCVHESVIALHKSQVTSAAILGELKRVTSTRY